MKIKKNFGNTPFGALSETQGYATETNNFGEAAFGILNKSTIDEDNFTSPDVVKSSKATLFSVGNGSNGVRKNIIELKADGTVYISGIGSYDGTTTDGVSTIQDAIQDTNDQVQNVIEELEKVNTSIDSINIEKSQDSDLVYTLRVDGEDRGTINIPKDQFLKDVSYNDVTNELVFTFVTKDTDNKEVRVNLTDLVDIYTAGNGINIDNKQISVKIDGTSDPYITISENGVKVSGIDEEITALNAKDTELNSKIGSNTYEGSNYLTKETNLTDAVIQLDEEIKATNDNLALEHANAEATYAKKTELGGYLPLSGGDTTGSITATNTDGFQQLLDETNWNSGINNVVQALNILSPDKSKLCGTIFYYNKTQNEDNDRIGQNSICLSANTRWLGGHNIYDDAKGDYLFKITAQNGVYYDTYKLATEDQVQSKVDNSKWDSLPDHMLFAIANEGVNYTDSSVSWNHSYVAKKEDGSYDTAGRSTTKTINGATSTTAGVMSASDKTKLDSINLAGIQVVTALPDAPNENTMYIVIPA